MKGRSSDVILETEDDLPGHKGSLEKITITDPRNFEPHSQRKIESGNEITEEFPGNENWENDYIIQKSRQMGDGSIEEGKNETPENVEDLA